MEKRMANTSDTNENLWDHIHALFNKCVEDGDLSLSDRRPMGDGRAQD